MIPSTPQSSVSLTPLSPLALTAKTSQLNGEYQQARISPLTKNLKRVKVGVILSPNSLQQDGIRITHDSNTDVLDPSGPLSISNLADSIVLRQASHIEYPDASQPHRKDESHLHRTQLQERESHGEDGAGCGWLFFRPKCLQSKQTAKWVLFWLCWAGAVQGMVVNGFVNVSITTIEKRYRLKSADTGFIAGAYDMASLLCSVPVSYFGSMPGASKPRWLGWGMFLMGLGSFVFSVPHFVSPYFKDLGSRFQATEDVLLCLTQGNTSAECGDATTAWLSSFRHVFAAGQFLHGMGAAPLYTLGITFLDESVPVRASSLYLGLFYAMAIVGPACGFVLGGQLLNVYIDSPDVTPSQLGIYASSDQWLGAWWIGFLISGTLAFVIGVAVMAFPKEIPGSRARASQRALEINPSTSVNAQKFENIKDLWKASKGLACNLTFVCLSLAGATEGILLTGFATFMPKFIESQFSISASNAALLVGMVAVPAGGGGTLIGGWIIKHFYLKCAGNLKLCALLSTLCFVSCLSFVISCPDTQFAGVTVGYMNNSLSPSPNLMSSCNADCGCENVPFDPVCGTDQILYFSPCHAGCNSVTIVNGRKVFDNCKCISLATPSLEKTPYVSSSSLGDSTALLQKCPSSCSLMTIFIAVFFVIMTITFIISLPAVSGTLRCVPDSHRSLALGLQWIIIRVLGTIPGPILFGIVIDSTCRLWQSTCNVDGACRNYDNLQMSRSMLAISLIFKCLSTVFFFLAWWFYSPMQRDRTSGAFSLDETTTSTTSSLASAQTPTAAINLGFEES